MGVDLYTYSGSALGVRLPALVWHNITIMGWAGPRPTLCFVTHWCHVMSHLDSNDVLKSWSSNFHCCPAPQMMLMDNLIHSDLHPGNILVRLTPPLGLVGALYSCLDTIKASDAVSNVVRARIDLLQQRWLQPQMVLLDVGMATELTDEDQTNMIGLFQSFAAMNGRACGEWTLRFSGATQQCPDPEGFKNAMEAAFDELRRLDEGASWEDTAFKNSADTLGHVLELVRQHKVSLPGHICAVVVTTLVLEGWSNKLDPHHSVLTQVGLAGSCL